VGTDADGVTGFGTMKILYLGPPKPEIQKYLQSFGDEVITCEEPLVRGMEILDGVDFIISFGYRHIIRQDLIEVFPSRIVNLHISLLPWNRGADPNLWSFLENTPKGVSIHFIDEGVDTGHLLAQREVAVFEDDTLRSSYERLAKEMVSLFRNEWPNIRDGRIPPVPQCSGGTYHRTMDRIPYEHLMTSGWDTPVRSLVGKALKCGSRQG